MKAKTHHFPITDFVGRGGGHSPFNLCKIVDFANSGYLTVFFICFYRLVDLEILVLREKRFVHCLPCFFNSRLHWSHYDFVHPLPIHVYNVQVTWVEHPVISRRY